MARQSCASKTRPRAHCHGVVRSVRADFVPARQILLRSFPARWPAAVTARRRVPDPGRVYLFPCGGDRGGGLLLFPEGWFVFGLWIVRCPRAVGRRNAHWFGVGK